MKNKTKKIIFICAIAIMLMFSSVLRQKNAEKDRVNAYNQGYVQGRKDAFSEAVVCYGANLPVQTDINYPCEE